MRVAFWLAAGISLAALGCSGPEADRGAPDGGAGVSGPRDGEEPAAGDSARVMKRSGDPSFTEAPAEGAPVAEIGSRVFTTGDVSALLLKRNTRQFQDIVRELVLNHVVDREAEELGVGCTDAESRERLSATVEREENLAREQAQLDYQMTLEEVLQANENDIETFRKGLEDRYRAEMPYTIRMERLARFWSLTTQSVDASRIVVADRARAEEILRKVRDGASFAQIAKEESIDDFGRDGGKLPRIYRGSGLGKTENLLFSMQAGQISDVLDEGGAYSIYLANAANAKRDVRYSEIEGEVLESLRSSGVSQNELNAWLKTSIAKHGGVKRHYNLPGEGS
ncbi:MAG: peptidylprolyl isomerase [Planctomycetes bacterium]|nr:peptidylprolyl isomerase [Planctomycetota bacterium]